MSYPDQPSFQRLFLHKELVYATADRGGQSQSINPYFLAESILAINRKTAFLGWLLLFAAIAFFQTYYLVFEKNKNKITQILYVLKKAL